MIFRHCADNVRYKTMTNQELKSSFVLENLFKEDEINLYYSDVDRAVVAGISPNSKPIKLTTYEGLSADFFCQRREVGVINIGGRGTVTVDGESFDMNNRDSLYIGRGSEDIVFENTADGKDASFYMVSYPAHTKYPSRLVTKAEATKIEMGDQSTSNERTIYQPLAPQNIDSCQLVMGFTELKSGSVWNTKPPHTHGRRSEIYMYFDFDEEERVFHFMGEPQELKSVILEPKQAIVSPSWSIHSGAGSTNYTFIWAMGGENQEFGDMDHLKMSELK